jgi:hypothetical protein
MRMTMMSSRLIVTRKVIPAILRLVNLRTLMRATQLQTLRMLLRKILLSLKYHPKHTNIATTRLINYSMRKSNPKTWRSFLLRALDLNKKRSSLVQIATPKMPSAKLRM